MIDLHIHTTASDGEFSPSEIIDKALLNGLTHIAITDHDTINGLDEAISYAKGKNIVVIPGVELNAKVSKGQMHILGYFIDYSNTEFIKAMKKFEEERNSRNDKFIEMFNQLGIDISLEDVKKYAIGTVIGKPHFARVLLEKGYTQDIEEGFDKFFNQEPLKSIKRISYSPKEIIKLIKSAGGTAVLAHPQSLKLDNEELERTILELKDLGLDGLECYHSKQSDEEMNFFKTLAEKHNMLITLGSDYHRDVSISNIELGEGKNRNLITSLPDTNFIINQLSKIGGKI